MNRSAVAGLFRKELLDVSRNRGALMPVVLVTAIALVVPFVVTIAVPAGDRRAARATTPSSSRVAASRRSGRPARHPMHAFSCSSSSSFSCCFS